MMILEGGLGGNALLRHLSIVYRIGNRSNKPEARKCREADIKTDTKRVRKSIGGLRRLCLNTQ